VQHKQKNLEIIFECSHKTPVHRNFAWEKGIKSSIRKTTRQSIIIDKTGIFWPKVGENAHGLQTVARSLEFLA
jgi:hypothetical protein